MADLGAVLDGFANVPCGTALACDFGGTHTHVGVAKDLFVAGSAAFAVGIAGAATDIPVGPGGDIAASARLGQRRALAGGVATTRDAEAVGFSAFDIGATRATALAAGAVTGASCDALRIPASGVADLGADIAAGGFEAVKACITAAIAGAAFAQTHGASVATREENKTT